MEEPVTLVRGSDKVTRCWWCAASDDYIRYHDDEWGRPVVEEHRLFEKICLEGFQSGLSWLTILRKRESFRESFAQFDFHQVAKFGDNDVKRLLENAGIVRHRGKIESTINNAKRAIELSEEFGSLATYFWQYEPRKRAALKNRSDIVASSSESTAMSKDLKRRGWSFVGPTTCYAFMQAMGLVNDHFHRCATWRKVEQAKKAFVRPAIK